MRRLSGWKVIGILGLTTLSGCMMPAYRFPAGFSSSFHRHLYSGDPRALPHQLPQNPFEGDAPRRLPAATDLVIPPEDEKPQLDLPERPVDPETHPTPPAPLPDDADLPPQPTGENPVHNDPAAHEPPRRAVANTAMSLPE